MHTPGHVGIALIIYAPVGAVLALQVDPATALLGGVIAVGAAPLPDLDEWIPRIPHRGPTHSICSILALSALATLAGAVLAVVIGREPLLIGAVCGGVALLTLSSHLAADSLTPMGIWPYWPLSRRHYTFDVVRSAHPRLNWSLFVAGVVLTFATAGILVWMGV